MKRVVMAFALVSTVASVASAQLLRSSPKPSAPAPASTLIARQAPVPMQPRSRPSPFVPPAAAPASAQSPAVETTSGETPADTIPGGLTEGDARAAIEADGYKNARVVSKTVDGSWRARALRGTTEVSLRVDAQGNVMVD